MTSGDEAGALKEESRVDSAEEAHDLPAPAEPDPGGADIDDNAGEDAGEGDVKDASASASDASEDAAASESEDSGADDAGDPAAGSADDSADGPDGSFAGDSDDAGDSGDSDDSDDFDDDDGDVAGRPASAGLWAASVAVLVVVLIAGLVTAGMYWNRASGASATSNGQQQAESVARTAVTDLISANYKDPQGYAAKIKQVAVGKFLNEFGNASSGFAKILTEGQVQTSGTIEEVGVEKFDGNTAQFAVLANVTVKNTQTPQGAPREYRLQVSMIQSGSKWLVSNVEFVQ